MKSAIREGPFELGIYQRGEPGDGWCLLVETEEHPRLFNKQIREVTLCVSSAFLSVSCGEVVVRVWMVQPQGP